MFGQAQIAERYVRAEKRETEIYRILPVRFRRVFEKMNICWKKVMEIRIRVQDPFIIFYDNQEYFICDKGLSKDKNAAYKVTALDIRETMEYVSNYSLYAYEENIRQGFITVQGGHRIGLAGKVVCSDGKIKCVRHISFINIRVSHEIKGCSQSVMPFIFCENRPLHTLIISPPGGGKTTLLRDIVRTISNNVYSVGVVDERSEIAASYKGIPQNDVGIRTDVLDGCPKAFGILMLIRSMNPRVIAVDELGDYKDVEAVQTSINCGCVVIATIHGGSIDDVKNRPGVRNLVEQRLFDRYILLGNENNVGSVNKIFDKRGCVLYENENAEMCINNTVDFFEKNTDCTEYDEKKKVSKVNIEDFNGSSSVLDWCACAELKK